MLVWWSGFALGLYILILRVPEAQNTQAAALHRYARFCLCTARSIVRRLARGVQDAMEARTGKEGNGKLAGLNFPPRQHTTAEVADMGTIDLQSSIRESYSPCVLVVSTPDADELTARNGLALTTLLRPFADVHPTGT